MPLKELWVNLGSIYEDTIHIPFSLKRLYLDLIWHYPLIRVRFFNLTPGLQLSGILKDVTPEKEDKSRQHKECADHHVNSLQLEIEFESSIRIKNSGLPWAQVLRESPALTHKSGKI